MMQTMNKKYIYNPTFANWLIVNGATIVGAGVGSQGDTYFLFQDSDTFQRLCKEWNPTSKKR